MSQTTRKSERPNHENRRGLHLSFCRGAGSGREFAELMAGIAPYRRGDAFNMAKRQDDCSNGKEETTANNTPGRTQAGPDELGKDVLPVER
jgi:hypothetical protein